MRKLFAFMVAAVFSFGMVGCGDKAPAKTEPPKTEPAKTEPAKTDAPAAPKTEEPKKDAAPAK